MCVCECASVCESVRACVRACVRVCVYNAHKLCETTDVCSSIR